MLRGIGWLCALRVVGAHMKPYQHALTLVVGAASLLFAVFAVLKAGRSAIDALKDTGSILELVFKMWTEAPIWAIALIVIGLGNLFSLWVWPWLCQRVRGGTTDEPRSAPRSDWQQEWHELRFRRRDFWSSVIRAYDYWNEDHGYGHPPLHTLIDAAPFPSDLPLGGSDVRFPDWVWSFSNPQLTGEAAALNGLATAIYPAAKPAMSATSLIFLGGYAEFCKFDDYRAELSKFWDHWGRQEPLEQVIREQRADDLVKNHAREIKLLIYLEIARERWAQQGAPGKGGLFVLGRRNVETAG
jgi:hypothetical protein